MTDVAHGVRFEFFPGKPPVQISWTDKKFGNGWLALDRNGNGTIDDSSELFGNLTAQPPSSNPNGYAALAVFDKPENGGNGNGLIDRGDSIFAKLVVWVDSNNNGISQARELHSLNEVGIYSIDLQYTEIKYIDKFGNVFRYASHITDKAGSLHSNCYDVILQFAHLQ